MTPEEHEALDKRIATEVMGWTLPRMAQDTMTYPDGKTVPLGPPFALKVPRFSTDIAAAWQVVEHMRARGLWCQFEYGPGGGLALARFTSLDNKYGMGWTSAEAMPLAICYAALAAIEATDALTQEGT